MVKVLLPVKPQYALQIMEGKKRIEYRKKRFARNDVTSIIIYATAPIQKVLGEVEFIGIIEDTPDNVWDQTHYWGGICRKAYEKYFHGCDKAYAYGLGKVIQYPEVKILKDFGINYDPQSYVYIK